MSDEGPKRGKPRLKCSVCLFQKTLSEEDTTKLDVIICDPAVSDRDLDAYMAENGHKITKNGIQGHRRECLGVFITRSTP